MSGRDGNTRSSFVGLAVNVVSVYVSNHLVPARDLPELITSVHASLSGLSAAKRDTQPAVVRPSPAQIRKSVTADHLISFEDGKPYKTLKRHLTLRALTAEAYRAKYGLPRDYPMTAANYSARRAQLARDLGLGQQRRSSASNTPAPMTRAEEAPAEASQAEDAWSGADPTPAVGGARTRQRSHRKAGPEA
ncbi:MucR family transcriptional regulator [Methylobacterium planeticum]|uniref:MucR family transcriptional regulator n=1 Tax=Methylobacterium planeticum TaxID=2615211 RepID=A0A6N6MW17_9HYPH|nr:MucR family transcriptional regulator [Methylobacterium planeticum]KAB1073989.1 MucR family transcriptional regulator [Methylobacterium planeticum]